MTTRNVIKKELPFIKSRIVLAVFVFGYLMTLTLLLQGLSGAYGTEFGSHPDEAAHYVTGVMVYDYLSGNLGEHPMKYAFNYYDHYPKVAIGHWPPGFYAAFGAWALLFSPSRFSTLIFLALITSVMAFFVFAVVRNRIGVYWGLGCATMLVLTPLVQEFTGSVMVDTSVALLCLLTAVAFIRYLEKPRFVFAFAFGTFAAAAVLTKQSGMLMALVVLSSMVLSRRLGLIKRWSFWAGNTIVIAVSVPWLLFNYRIVKGAWTDPWGVAYSMKALPLFLGGLLNTVGYAVLAVAAIGFASLCVKAFRRPEGIAPFWAVAASLPAGVIVFHSIVPAAIGERYLITALPGVLVLGIAGINVIAGQLSRKAPRIGHNLRAVLAISVFALFVVEQFEIPQKRFEGFGPIVDCILSEDPVSQQHILISSDARGEGALIAEVAMAETKRPNHVVHRASKVLSSSDWMGRSYTPRFESDSALLGFLEQSSISWVVVDKTVSKNLERDHHRLVEQALRRNPDLYTEIDTFPITRSSAGMDGRAILYRKMGISRAAVRKNAGGGTPPQPVSVSVRSAR